MCERSLADAISVVFLQTFQSDV